MKLSSCHVLILMCRYNVTTNYSSAQEVIESKLQVFPEDVVVRCNLIPTPIDALESLLVARRVDYAGASCKIYVTGAHHPRGPLFPGQLTGIAIWPAGTRPRRRRRPRHERFCGPKYSKLVIYLVWMQTFTFVYGKR